MIKPTWEIFDDTYYWRIRPVDKTNLSGGFLISGKSDALRLLDLLNQKDAEIENARKEERDKILGYLRFSEKEFRVSLAPYDKSRDWYLVAEILAEEIDLIESNEYSKGVEQ
jgi:hypothetical protein